jgi:hypothetical protein
MISDYERKIAQRFVDLLNQQQGTQYALSDGSNPPDFLLDSPNKSSWLEVTDIYMNQEQAKFENCPSKMSHSFFGDISDTAVRLTCQLDRKLAKESYAKIVRERGKGMLLLTCQDWAFDSVNLAQVDELLSTFNPTADQKSFEIAYFEYRLDGQRVYGEIYPGRDLYP